jgi:ataxin-10
VRNLSLTKTRFHHDNRIEAGVNPQLWSDLRKLWRDLTRTQFSFWENDDSEDEDEISEDGQGDFLRAMCTSLAKFTRNLVAEVPGNQSRALWVS